MSSEEKLLGWREIPIAGVPYKPSTEYKTGAISYTHLTLPTN